MKSAWQRLCRIWLLLFLQTILIVGCSSPEPPLVTAALLSPTPAPTAANPTEPPSPTPEPTFVFESPKELAFCTSDDLYLYPGYVYFNSFRAQREFLNAVTPSAIMTGSDGRYYPTILEKLPSLADDDAYLEPVTVQENNLIVNDAGALLSLEEGVRYRPSGCRESACAETYTGGEVQMDRLVVEFRLREDLKWSDGNPLTAHDSVFAYEVTQQPDFQGSGCGQCGLPRGADSEAPERTAEYVAVNAQTVRWTGLPGYHTPGYFLNFFSPMPSHLLEGLDLDEINDFTARSRGSNMVGWGPFRIADWVQKEYLRVERNPYYYRAQEGLPFLDAMEWVYVSEEKGLEGVLGGQCAIASAYTIGSGILKQVGQGGQTNGEVESYVAPQGWEGILFNLTPSPARPDFFGDARVRQAIAFGTDRVTIARAVVGDDLLVAKSYLPAQHYLYAGETLADYLFSPERARDLLSETGWVDTDEDGVLEKGGQSFVVTLVTTSFEERVPGLTIFQENMAAIGIQVEIEFLDYSGLYAEDGPLVGRTFDLYWENRSSTTWWLSSTHPDCASSLTSAIPAPDQLGQWAYQNFMGYSNPDFDAACQLGLTNLDPQEAREAHILAQQIFSQDLPVLPLYFWPSVVLSRPEVVGLQIDFYGQVVNFGALDILDNR